MRLSTRNQFPGTVVSITKGEAMAVVKVAVHGTDLVVTAAVTRDAVEDLGLEVGSATYALVKSTEVCPNRSSPRFAISVVSAPSRRAAMAWFNPFPPG